MHAGVAFAIRYANHFPMTTQERLLSTIRRATTMRRFGSTRCGDSQQFSPPLQIWWRRAIHLQIALVPALLPRPSVLQMGTTATIPKRKAQDLLLLLY
jgi:hypothetical protein